MEAQNGGVHNVIGMSEGEVRSPNSNPSSCLCYNLSSVAHTQVRILSELRSLTHWTLLSHVVVISK